MSREKKIMEYEDSPSGFVTLYNYKEPFMKYEKGFGFQGVLLFDGETDKVQCHLCGQWFTALGNHTIREHNMKVAQYKEEVGLTKNTALIGEKMRAKLIANGLSMKRRMANLTGMVGKKHTEESKRKISMAMKENRRELQNINGTCPEQLIDRLLKEYVKQGRTPDTHTLPFYEAMMRTYGTYKNACEIAGIPYNDPLEALKRGHETQRRRGAENERLALEFVSTFMIQNNRAPIKADFRSMDKMKLYGVIIRNGGLDEYVRQASIKSGHFSERLKGFRFTKEELIEFLRNFKTINGRIPSHSDARRGLIPYPSRYTYHFGSWKNTLNTVFGNGN